jgi:DNA-binding CsgD family transcriptional regulator
MDEHGDALAQAQQAYAERDWPTAAACFDAADSEQLTADDLAVYSDAAFWLGRVDDVLRLRAAACEALEADARPAEAAMAAFTLGVFYLSRGEEEQGTGWMGRAHRLAADLPESPVHAALLSFTGVEANLMAGRPAEALDAARRGQEIGRRCGDAGLVAMHLQGEGRALIRSGQLADGLALIDEAMVTAENGRLDPFLTGTLYCHTVATCHEIADVRRLTRWTELTERWLATLPGGGVFEGLCGVHRAQLHLLHGAWDKAERGALRIAKDFDEFRVDYAAEAWYVVAEARRLRGDPDAAQAYDETHARGRDPQPGRALLRLQQGDAAGAATSVRSALTAVGDDPLRRAPICAAVVEIAVAAGQLDNAADAASELAATAATYATSGLETMARAARGAVLLAEGRAEEALPVLRDACRRWHELGAIYDAASTCLRLVEAYRALGDEVSASEEEARAQAAFERLGAHRPVLEPPDGLTRRECEVLALVADGCSNQQIGQKLYISDRTVGRHLTNIFRKIGVTSRTQAARYAAEHGISTSR